MKHIWLSLLLLLSPLFVFPQYQYSNNGFEFWDDNNEPTSWNSYPTAGGKLVSTVKNSEQITKSTDRHSGSYSAKLMVRDIKIIVHVAYANGMMTTGQISGNSATASSPDNNNVSNIKDGYAMTFTGLPDSMSIWLKSSYTSTSQKTRLHVLLHDNEQITDPNTTWTSVVAVAGANVPANNGVWQRTSIPFYYKGESLVIDCDVNGTSTSQTHKPASTSKRPSYVLATIATNYMAGQGSATDVLLVDDVMMIYNSSLKSLSVNDVSVSGFSKTKYSYAVNSVYTEGCVKCDSDGHGATVSGSYDASTAVYTIVVKGDDYSVNSSNTHTYKIQFNQPKTYESLLTSLKVNGTSVSNFSSSTYAYTVSNAAYSTSTVDYTASTDATVEKSFDSSTNVLTLTVKGGDYATNSKNVHTYKITFHAPFESLLTSLKVNGTSVPNFSSSTYAYTVSNAAYATSTVEPTASSDATVEKSFDSSTNVLTLTVKGGDYATNSKNVHTYKITFHAPFESLLTSLKVNGTSVSKFSSSTYAYTVSNAAYASSTVEPTASTDATVEKSFDSSTNILTLTVKGGDYSTNSKNVHTYKVTFHAPFESLLTSLKVNGTSVPNFSSSTYAYTISNAAYASSTVEPTASTDATVEKSFDSSTNVLTLTVKGGDYATNSKNVHTYKVTFHAPFESLLTSLKVNGTSVSKFSSSTYAYTVSNAAYASSTVEPTASTDATVEKSFDSSTNVLTLTVKGGDYATNSKNVHTYKVTFHAPFESLLTSLKVNGASVSKFSSSTYNYIVTDAAYATSMVDYTSSSEANVEKSYDATTDVLTLTVKGGDYATNKSNTHTYKITFHASFGSLLTSLKVNGTSVPNFSSSIFAYTLSDAAYETSTVEPTASADATVEKSFDSSTNVLTLTVKGGDYATNSKNIHTYKVTFHAPFESLLTSLKVNGTSVPNFSSSIFAYTLSDAAYETSTVEPVASSEAMVEKSFDSSTNVLTLTVKGGDYATNSKNIHTYKITFHASFESLLTSLKVNGYDVDKFSSSLYSYTVKNTFDASDVKYVASSEASVEESFDGSTNILTLTVMGGDISTNTSNKHVYHIQFYASSQLSDLKVDDVTIKGFESSKLEYAVDVTYEFSKTDFFSVDTAAVVSSAYDESTAMLTITVEGRDVKNFPDNVHVYKVHYHMPYTSSLSALTNNGLSLEDFSVTKYDYVVDEVYARSKIAYVADEFTSVEESFDSADNVLTLVVKGGDIEINPSNTHTYTIRFHAPYTSFLTDLAVNDVTIDGFAPDKFDYVVDGVYFKTKLDVLTDDYASYVAKYDLKSFVLTIRVESGDIALDPTNHHEYRIQFNDHNVYNSQMLDVMLNTLTMEQFDKDVYDYQIDGSYADITFSYTTDSLTHTEESFDPESNVLSITVQGGNMDRDSSNYHVYHFSFTEQFSYGAQITAVIYDGISVDWFDKDVYEYTVDLDFNRAHFSYTTNSLAEVYEFFDDETLTLSVVVIGGDMDYANMNEYIIHFASTSDAEKVRSVSFSLSYSDGSLSVGNSEVGDYLLYTLDGTLVSMGKVMDGRAEVGSLSHGVYIFCMNGKCVKVLI